MSHERRIDALDGVRGLAYLIVFFDHTVPAHAPTAMPNGQVSQ